MFASQRIRPAGSLQHNDLLLDILLIRALAVAEENRQSHHVTSAESIQRVVRRTPSRSRNSCLPHRPMQRTVPHLTTCGSFPQRCPKEMAKAAAGADGRAEAYGSLARLVADIFSHFLRVGLHAQSVLTRHMAVNVNGETTSQVVGGQNSPP